jgi:hypothetical protein
VQSVPQEVIEAIPNQLRPMQLPQALRALSGYRGWIPNVERALRTASEDSVYQRSDALTLFRGDVPVLEVREDADRIEYEAFSSIKLSYQLFATVHLPPLSLECLPRRD